MLTRPANRLGLHLLWFFTMIMALGLAGPAAAAEPVSGTSQYLILEVEGPVEVMRVGATVWDKGYTNQVLYPGDQVRTGDYGRALIRWSDLSLERMGERSRIVIPAQREDGVFIEFFRGILYFFHRDEPGRFDIRTPRVSAVVLGTEFMLQVDEDGTTQLTLFDGQVDMVNEFGSLSLASGQQAVVQPNQPPQRTAVIPTVNLLQWCLYYPGLVSLDELELAAEEEAALRDSLEAYRAGDLPQALQQYPAGRKPVSRAERIYRAAILLAVGRVDQCQELLGSLPEPGQDLDRPARLAEALRQLVAAVTLQPFERRSAPVLATEWLAESYYLQSQFQLEQAREAARAALRKAPAFGFALVRAAELEFSFGQIRKAQRLVTTGLALAPRNAQALALQGFLLSAQNRIVRALACFDQAIALDGALGNAWLGRGLCRIRQGQVQAGLQDIQAAATLEPQRAIFRSYLGKTYSQAGDLPHAIQEIQLAEKMDPNDPTALLYSALIKQQQNRINEAVRDLEKSQELNDNRSLYRSRWLLDQDRAVRSANLANIYADAGMDAVSLREAARGADADYANYSSHLFLANSYSRLRDPGLINLRYDTAAVSEYLLANLLAPVGAGTLSPTVSQQEYSKLLESDGVGIVSATEYLSRGAWNAEGAVYGAIGNTSFAFDTFYLNDNGQRVNEDLEITSQAVRIKQQLTSSDQLFGQVYWSHAEGGDLFPYYDPEAAFTNGGPNTLKRFTETQEPIALAGYHHEWAPGQHTLLLAGRLVDDLDVTDPRQPVLLVDKRSNDISGARFMTLGQYYESDQEIYSAEAQHISQTGPHTLIAGGRYQFGDIDVFNRHTPPPAESSWYTNLVEDFDYDYERANTYAYYRLQLFDPLLLEAGVSYDWVRFPANYRFAPLSDDEKTVDQVSPKAGLIWTPFSHTALRAGYSRTLGGVSLSETFRLEPSQVGGIQQAFRSIIPDAVSGAKTAEEFDVYGLAWDQAFPSHTYLGLAGQWLDSDVDQQIGVYDVLPLQGGVFPLPPFVFPSTTSQSLDYRERSVEITLNQLAGQEWAFGAAYRLSHAELDARFKDIPVTATLYPEFRPRQEWEAYLHQVRLFGIFNHPSGFFGKFESLWLQQSNQGYEQDLPGDDFWQFNFFAGYRVFQRRAELTFGVLNLTDEDYRLNPLNLSASLPRDRTFATRFRFNF